MARRSGLGRGLDALLPSTPQESTPSRPDGPDPGGPDPVATDPGGTDASGSRTTTPDAVAPAAAAGSGQSGSGPSVPDIAAPTVASGAGASPPGSTLRELSIDRIRPNRHQPRSVFGDEALEALTASIAELGVLQPILVREIPGAEDFELIAGERRWRASRRAGLTTIPAVVRTISDTRSLQEALVENLQREDLNAIEEALAYQQLIDEFSLTQEDVARAVGRSRSTVANTLRLLHLPSEVQVMVVEGRLSAGHARALLGLDDHGTLVHLAERIEREGLSVRETEDAVRRANEPPAPAPTRPPGRGVRPAALLEVEDRLSDHFDTRVQVDLGARSGKLVVTFADLEDLDRIFNLIVVSRPDIDD